MKVTLLKNNQVIPNYPANSLSEISLNIFPDCCSLESLVNPSEENLIVDWDEKLFDNISYRDVIDEKDILAGNLIVFQLLKENDKSILIANEFKAVEFSFEDIEQIDGNLPDDCYSIHSMFQESLHRTKDFFKHIAISMAPENEKWEDYYYKAFDEAIRKYNDDIKNGGDASKINVWIKETINQKTKWKNCVEFSNMKAFAKAYEKEIDQKFNATPNEKIAKDILYKCNELKRFRNDSAHDIESLYNKESASSLDSAMGKMSEMVNRLGNKALKKKIDDYREEISQLYNDNLKNRLKKMGIINP